MILLPATLPRRVMTRGLRSPYRATLATARSTFGRVRPLPPPPAPLRYRAESRELSGSSCSLPFWLAAGAPPPPPAQLLPASGGVLRTGLLPASSTAPRGAVRPAVTLQRAEARVRGRARALRPSLSSTLLLAQTLYQPPCRWSPPPRLLALAPPLWARLGPLVITRTGWKRRAPAAADPPLYPLLLARVRRIRALIVGAPASPTEATKSFPHLASGLEVADTATAAGDLRDLIAPTPSPGTRGSPRGGHVDHVGRACPTGCACGTLLARPLRKGMVARRWCRLLCTVDVPFASGPPPTTPLPPNG